VRARLRLQLEVRALVQVQVQVQVPALVSAERRRTCLVRSGDLARARAR
jgi:hypothetical protein